MAQEERAPGVLPTGRLHTARRPKVGRSQLPPLLAVLIAALLMAVPVALGAAPSQPLPGQRVDMKVLLVASNVADGVYAAWKTQLERAGVPFDTVLDTDPALTDAKLADYSANRAKYQAVIAVDPDSRFTPAEQTALTKLEETFGIRQLNDNVYPNATHGLNAPTQSGDQIGGAQLTPVGKSVFPNLKGPVPFASPNYGHQATPLAGANFTTLLTGLNNSAAVGINVRANGTEEMVNTVPGNQFQSHHQLLRDGMLAWVTRGVYLGYARNYLGLDIDDVFLPDDKWDPVNNVNDYTATIRMDAGDVSDAVGWQNRTGLKLNMVYNMFGVEGIPADPLLAAFKANKNEFRWINHTYAHPNLDCTTAAYTANQITQNQSVFNANFNTAASPLAAGRNDPSELVTGEHSGLANLAPGNPGTIDPPVITDFGTDATAPAPGLAAGAYEYGITASTAAAAVAGNETPASTTAFTVTAPSNRANVSWESICKAVSYKVYRRTASATPGPWQRIGTSNGLTSGGGFTFPSAAFGTDGAADIQFTDPGVVGTAAAPPAGNSAIKTAYAQNPFFIPALTSAGVKTIASDTSKPYPNPPESQTVSATATTNYAPGSTFKDGPAQALPRYPSNVYYNVANRADQLDEYNWIYASPAAGGNCVASAVTTCRTTLATWQEYLDSEVGIITNHVMGNDPRPHYFHQTNIAQYNPADADNDTSEGGTLYAVVNTLLGRYDASIDRASTPLVQLSQDDAAKTLVRQNAWAADIAAGRASGYIQDGKVHIVTTAAMEVPITGTTEGSRYAGTKSGWKSVAANSDTVLTPADPANTVAPSISGAANPGVTLTATEGTWTGTGTIVKSFQWQRSLGTNGPWTSIVGATTPTYALQTSDEGSRFRVAVSARNWISSVSLEFSAATAVVAKPVPEPPVTTPPAVTPPVIVSPPVNPPATPAPVQLVNTKMAPRRFSVRNPRRVGQAKSGVKLGSSITWSIDKAATMKIRVERLASGSKKVKRWTRVGTIKKSAQMGKGTLKFSGRVAGKRLARGSYRVVVSATADGLKSASRTITFTVVKG